MSRHLDRVVVMLMILGGGWTARAQQSPGRPEPPPGRVERGDRRLVIDSSRPGFRNPGGVGRRAEYYPAGDRFQNPGRTAAHVPSFGEYPAFTSRAMQLQSQFVGGGRVAATDQHMDVYGRPMFLFWFPWLGPGWRW